MKNKIVLIIFLILFLLLTGCSGRYIEKVDLPAKQNFHLFLLAGQSNMAGRGIISAEDSIINPKILMLTKEYKWVAAVDPIHYDKTSAGVGLAKSFALKIAESDTNIIIGLIPAACGGSSISSWESGGYHDQTKSYPYDDAIARTRKAMEYGELKGILWHQGESDSNPRNAVQYQGKLINLILNFRKDLDSKNVPFIIGQLGQFPEKSWSESRILVDEVQRSIQKEVAFVSFVSSYSLTSKVDNIHFNSESLKIFGKRYAKAYLEMKK